LVDFSSLNNAGIQLCYLRGNGAGRAGRTWSERGKRGVDSVERSVESEGNGCVTLQAAEPFNKEGQSRLGALWVSATDCSLHVCLCSDILGALRS
jgi:hypothetical protein